MSIAEYQTDRIASLISATRGVSRDGQRARWEVGTDLVDSPIFARVAGDWLLFEAPLRSNPRLAGATTAFLPEQLAGWNALLPGGARFGVDARFNITVRADVPLIDDFDPGPRALEALSGIEAGLAWFDGCEPSPRGAVSVEVPVDFKLLADETGWALCDAPDGDASILVPAPAGPVPVQVEAHGETGMRAWIAVAELDDLTPHSRHALAVLLLRASSVLRLARPAFARHHERQSAVFEVVFDSAPGAAEFNHAIESLAVSIAMAASEVKLLCEEQTARDYLIVGDWIPRDQGEHNNNQP
ncbi:MAG: hypothetical protein QOF48_2789 [Verrucomicrobiota bacterium]|jgi:hypothetical protein